VQGLVDAAMVVVTVVIPTLSSQLIKKIFHAILSKLIGTPIIQKSCENSVTHQTDMFWKYILLKSVTCHNSVKGHGQHHVHVANQSRRLMGRKF
jgi:hypothetical protein